MTFRPLAAVFCISVALAHVAPAQGPARAFDQIEQARLKYERDMDAARAQVIDLLADAHDRAADAKPASEQAVTQIKNERERFLAEGQWPAAKGIAGPKARVRNARQTLLKAYSGARTMLAKAGDASAAALVEAERIAIEAEDDLVPWVTDLVGQGADAVLTGSQPKRIDLRGSGSGAYRLEIIATRTGGEGPLEIRAPAPGGQFVAFEAMPRSSVRKVPAGGENDADPDADPADTGLATPEDGARVRVLLSLRDASVSPELGVMRPLTLSKGANRPTALELRSLDPRATFRIDSVRIKPIFAARAEELPAKEPKPAPKGGSPQPRTPTWTDLLPVRSKWAGTVDPKTGRKNDIACNVNVVRNSDGEVWLKLDWDRKTAQLRFVADGNRLTLVAVTDRFNPEGEAYFEGEDLRINFRWMADNRRSKNNTVEGSAVVRRR